MDNFIYQLAKTKMMVGQLNLELEPVYASLVAESFSPDETNDIRSVEVSRLGSSVELTAKTIQDAVFGADDVTFSGLGIGLEVEGIVLHTSSVPILYIGSASYGLPMTTTGGPVTIVWSKGPNRIFKL